MTLRITILCFLLLPILAIGQVNREVEVDHNYEDDWVYFSLTDTIEIEILTHRAGGACGKWASASLTIGETSNGDTIRVLDLCNKSEEYSLVERYKVAPAKKPDFGVVIPYMLTSYTGSKKAIFELTVLNTTYGKLLVHETTTPNTNHQNRGSK
jgi:hypothetical protein